MNTAASTTRSKPGIIWRWMMPFLVVLFASVLAIPLATRLDPVVGDVLLAGSQKTTRVSQDVAIVAITEATLEQFPYRSPIDRGFLAGLITTLETMSPKAIGVDILLDTPSDPAKDRQLYSKIENAKVPVILASAQIENGLTGKQAAYLNGVLGGKRSGSIVLHRDKIDGVVRHLPEIRDINGNPVQTFAETLAGVEISQPSFSGRILYRPSTAGPVPAFPAHTVELLPPEWFTGKIVLIGTDLPNIDRHIVPAPFAETESDNTLPGITVHAHILEQLLSGRDLPTLKGWQSFVLLILGAAISVLMFNVVAKPGLFFLGLLLAISGYFLTVYVLLSREIILLPLVAPPAAALFAALLFSLSRWWKDRSEREFLEVAFSQYVSKTVVQRLTSGNIKLSLGGEKRLVTYLFTDLEGFTSLSQSLAPDQISTLLNTYLDRMCDLITEHGATIDKIIGDAVVCFFGAPDADQNQAENAVRLALELDRLCEGFRKECHQKGIALGATRIGLHMGEAVIGNFGGKRFFDYTGIGDTVNTAARLESVNRHLGTRICVSDEIARHSPDLSFRPLGELVLKGRHTALPCFEPCSSQTLSEPWMQVYLSAYRHLEQKEEKALERFEEVAALKPDDGPTRFHLNRLREEGIVDAQVTMWEK